MFINEGIPIVIATIPESAGLTALSWPRNEAKGISWPCVSSPSIYVNFRLTSSIVLDKGTDVMRDHSDMFEGLFTQSTLDLSSIYHKILGGSFPIPSQQQTQHSVPQGIRHSGPINTASH